MASTGGRALRAVSIRFSSSVGSVYSGSGIVRGSTGPRCWYGSRMSSASGGCSGLKILLQSVGVSARLVLSLTSRPCRR